MVNELLFKILALSKLKGIGTKTLGALTGHPEFVRMDMADLAHANTALKKALQNPKEWDVAQRAAEGDIHNAVLTGSRIISIHDAAYPELLKCVPDHPFILYIKGEWPKDPNKTVAVIGSRRISQSGKIHAKNITRHLVENDFSIVSGLAFGCDAIAHKTALDCKGHTIAVLAHGLQTMSPKAHFRLAGSIVDNGGLLVSEYTYGIEPASFRFVKRDRIQAGLSRGVVMIQSALDGGSMNATRASLDYGRPLILPHISTFSKGSLNTDTNSVLSGPSIPDKKALLKCAEKDLDRVFTVKSEKDYPAISKLLTMPFSS
jgi:DNA processing protein